jgi:RNA polymerase sigma-70 factor (ECF subfamily)
VSKTTDSKASPAQPSDTQLLVRHIEGDPTAFETLVERYRRELFNFLARFTGDRALAEDIFQEAFLQVHMSSGSFDTSRRLKPWLFTIAANKARDALRKRSRKQAAPLDATVAGSENDRTSYADLLPADIPAPDESLLNLETRRGVQSIVEQMPETLRAVLMLSYFNGFAYKEIADILGIPLGTVKSRLHAAVKHFAKKWKKLQESQDHESNASQ